jgi:hypothetical protein
MKPFSLHGTVLNAPYEGAFGYIADPGRLPEWTNAFKHVKGGRARMETPAGGVDVELRVAASREHGTIDWHMTFPDGTVERAFSRLTESRPGVCLYSFMLTPPAAAAERLEGTLDMQAKILEEELNHLKHILERG